MGKQANQIDGIGGVNMRRKKRAARSCYKNEWVVPYSIAAVEGNDDVQVRSALTWGRFGRTARPLI